MFICLYLYLSLLFFLLAASLSIPTHPLLRTGSLPLPPFSYPHLIPPGMIGCRGPSNIATPTTVPSNVQHSSTQPLSATKQEHQVTLQSPSEM